MKVDINFTDLRLAVKEFNESGLLETPMKVVGVKKDKVIDLLIENVEKADDAGLSNKLPDSVYNLYTSIAEQLEEGKAETKPETEPEEPAKAPVKKASTKKAETKKEEPKPDTVDLPKGYAAARKKLIGAGVAAKKIDAIELIHRLVRKDNEITLKKVMNQLKTAKLVISSSAVQRSMERALA